MAESLAVLVVEDRPQDAELMLAELRRSGIAPNWRRVTDEAQFLAALAAPPDIVLADFGVPRFGASQVLDLMAQRGLDVPVIVVSGSVGEDLAVEMIQRGAADYLLKDRLARLGPAVLQALRQRQLRHEKQQAEASLRASEEQLRLALDGGRMGLWQWDLVANLATWNTREYEVLGLPAGEGKVDGEAFFRWIHPEDSPRVRHEVDHCLQSGESLETEMRIVRPDGQVRWIVSRGMVQRDDAGNAVRMIGVNYDVTSRKQAEEELCSSRHMLETVINNIPQGVFWKDRNSAYLGCNRVILKSRGFRSLEQIVGKHDRELPGLKPEEAEFFVQKDREVMETGLPTIGIVEPMTLPDGSTIWLETSKLPLQDTQGRVIGVLGTWQDITERLRLEEELRQSQKMEAIGRLAGGVAHDFNNLLTVILGYSELALGSLSPADEQSRDHLEAIRDAGERASSLTRQLLAFSRKQMLEPRLLDLNGVIAGSEKLLRRLIGEDIMLVTHLAAGLPQVKVDPGQIEQVVLNLVVNARDAMPGGGRLTLETSALRIARPAPEDSASGDYDAPPGEYVRLLVRDSGSGMTPQVQARIFEPFFSTKGPGHGTGLGLATVYGIVKQSDGAIKVSSEIGVGTTFEVLLPAVPARGVLPGEKSPPADSLAGGETILLVEDESAVRVLTRAALEKQGYRVLEAAHGREALALDEKHPGTIDLIITDVVMPEMSGRELVEVLLPKRRGMKVLFVSGYTEDALVRDGAAEATSTFLQKPFTLTALARKVRELLDGGVPDASQKA